MAPSILVALTITLALSGWLGMPLRVAAAAAEPRTSSSPPSAPPQAEAAQLKNDALALARDVTQAYPDDAFAYVLLGTAYHNTGKSEDALKQLRKGLELNPGLADAYGLLALIAYEKGDPGETARLCREALSRGSPNTEILNRLGRALLDLGQTDDAIRTLQQAVQLTPPSAESSYLLGQAFLQSGDPTRARDGFLKTVALAPDHTQAFFGLYTTCLRLQLTEEATRTRAQFEKLEAADRRSLADRSADTNSLSGLPLVRETAARTFFGGAQIHRAHHQPAKAVDLFLRAARLDADNPAYRAALESHFTQSNALAEGVAAFEQLVREQPDNPLNHYFLGRLHGRGQRLDVAETEFRQVQRLAPEWPQGYRALAELYLVANRQAPEALILARKTVELEPSAPHLLLLSQACLRNQDRPGAIAAAKRALALVPGDPRLRGYLQQIEQAPQPSP